MFWRRRSDEPKANRLSNDARPNELSFDTSEPNVLSDDEPEEFSEDDELEDAVYEDEPIDEDEDEAAREAAELQAEVEREAAEFGLAAGASTSLYGPNGEQVMLFLERLPDVSDDELEEHFDSWDSVPRADRQVAALAARDAEYNADLGFETESARRAVGNWIAESIREAEDKSGDAEAFYREMGRAVLEAAVALVLKEELDEADFETLGGSWAEEVAGRAVTEPPAADPERPIEAGELGPNTDLVIEFLDRLGRLTDDEVTALIAAWRGQPQRELREAHKELREVVAEDEEWREQVRKAQDRIQTWINRASEEFFGGIERRRPTPPRRNDAAPPVADAVAALVLGDLLEVETAEVLYDPWYQVVGEPELPVGDDTDDDDDQD